MLQLFNRMSVKDLVDIFLKLSNIFKEMTKKKFSMARIRVKRGR